MAEKSSFSSPDTSIDSVLQEQRKFECPEHFRERAHIKTLEEYENIYRESVEQPEKFWGRIAGELHWFKKWDKVLEWNNARGRSGLSAARSICRTTALTAMCRPGARTRPH